MSKSRYSSAHFLAIAAAAPDWQGKGLKHHEWANRPVVSQREASLKRRRGAGNSRRPGTRDSGISMCPSEEVSSASNTRSATGASTTEHHGSGAHEGTSDYVVTTPPRRSYLHRDTGIRITDETLQTCICSCSNISREPAVDSIYHMMVKEASRKDMEERTLLSNMQPETHQESVAARMPERETSIETLRAFCPKDSQDAIDQRTCNASRSSDSQNTQKPCSAPATTLDLPSRRVSGPSSGMNAATGAEIQLQEHTQLETSDEYSFETAQSLDESPESLSDRCLSILSSATTCVSADPARPIVPSRRSSRRAARRRESEVNDISLGMMSTPVDKPSNREFPSPSPLSPTTSPLASSSPITNSGSAASSSASRSSVWQRIKPSQSHDSASVIPISEVSSIQTHSKAQKSIDGTISTLSHTRSISNYSRPMTAPERSSSETNNSLGQVPYKSATGYGYPSTSLSAGYENTSTSTSLPNTPPSSIAAAINIGSSNQITDTHKHLQDSDLGDFTLGLGLDFDFDFESTPDLDFACGSHVYPTATRFPKASRAAAASDFNPSLVFDAEVRSPRSSSSLHSDDGSDCASQIGSRYAYINNDNKNHHHHDTRNNRGSSAYQPHNLPLPQSPHPDSPTDKDDATPPPIPISRSRPVARLLHPAPWLVEQDTKPSRSTSRIRRDRDRDRDKASTNHRSRSAVRSLIASSMEKVGLATSTAAVSLPLPAEHGKGQRRQQRKRTTSQPPPAQTQASTGEPAPTHREKYEQQQGSSHAAATPSDAKPSNPTPSYDWDWAYYSQHGIWKTKDSAACAGGAETGHVHRVRGAGPMLRVGAGAGSGSGSGSGTGSGTGLVRVKSGLKRVLGAGVA